MNTYLDPPFVVSLELYTKNGLSYVVNALGTPLYMDKIMASQHILAYAKVYVKIDVGAPILRTIDVILADGSKTSVAVDIPWLPTSCSSCKTFAHYDKSYLKKPSTFTKAWVPKAVLRMEKQVPDVNHVPVLEATTWHVKQDMV
ncbi:hypothetical protein REPUB_Repub10bG0123200 [Reevesia pubescens]